MLNKPTAPIRDRLNCWPMLPCCPSVNDVPKVDTHLGLIIYVYDKVTTCELNGVTTPG